MAQLSNPAKQFNYRVTIPGVPPFLVQKVTSPDYEFEVVEHGDVDRDIKTPGRVKIGSLTLEKLVNASAVDNSIVNWQKQIRSGAPAAAYKKPILIEQLAPDKTTVVKTYECQDCWPNKRNGVDFDSRSSENTVESVEFQVDDMDEY